MWLSAYYRHKHSKASKLHTHSQALHVQTAWLTHSRSTQPSRHGQMLSQSKPWISHTHTDIPTHMSICTKAKRMCTIYFISAYFLFLSALVSTKIYILLKWSNSPARPAAAPRPAPVSMFIHTAVQTSKKAGQKGKYYATLKGSSLCGLLSLWPVWSILTYK